MAELGVIPLRSVEMVVPDFMRHGWLVYPRKTQSLVNTPEEFYVRPLRYPEKFPQRRKIELTADAAAHIHAQEAAGYLVCDSVVMEVQGP